MSHVWLQNVAVPGLLVILLHHREHHGEWRQQGRCQIKVTENGLFYCSWIPWWSTRAQTHLACCLDASERVTWITFAWLSLIMHCQNSRSGLNRLSSGSKLIGWNALHHKLKLLCWPDDIHSVTWSTHPFSSRHTPVTKVAKWRAQGRNSQSDKNRHWLADANLYKNIYMSIK